MKTNFNLAKLLENALATTKNTSNTNGYGPYVSADYEIPDPEKKVKWDTVTFSARGTVLESGAAVNIAVSITPAQAQTTEPRA